MKEYSMVLTENLEDVSLDYSELTASVKELMQMHSELEVNINSMKTPLAKAYLKIRRAIGARPRYSVEDVLNMQLNIIKQLRRESETNANRIRTKLDSIILYSMESDLKIAENMDFREEELPNIGIMEKEIELQKIELQKLKPEGYSSEYIEKKHANSSAIREYSEAKHNFDLASEAVVDLMEQQDYLSMQEEVIRNTVYTSERIVEKTKRIENQLMLIRSTYDSVLKQQKLYAELYESLKAQRNYLTGLDTIIITGQQTMASISYRSETLNSFHRNSNSENVKDTIKQSDLDRRSELEERISEHFAKKKNVIPIRKVESKKK